MTTKEFFETAEKLFGPRFLNPTLCTGFAYSGTDLTRLGDTLPNKEVLEQLSLRPNVHIVPAPPEAIGYRWDLFDLVDRLKLAVPGEVLFEKIARTEHLDHRWIIIEYVVPNTLVSDGMSEYDQYDLLLKQRVAKLKDVSAVYKLHHTSLIEWAYALKLYRLYRPGYDPLSEIGDTFVRLSSRFQSDGTVPALSDETIVVTCNKGAINGYDFGITKSIPNDACKSNVGMSGIWRPA
jgi:hypothetical protein